MRASPKRPSSPWLEHGDAVSGLSLILGLDTPNVNRRCDDARRKLPTNRKPAHAKIRAESLHLANIAESQT